MKAKLISEQGEKTFAVIFDTGDEVMSGLLDVARMNKLDATQRTAADRTRECSRAGLVLDL